MDINEVIKEALKEIDKESEDYPEVLKQTKEILEIQEKAKQKKFDNALKIAELSISLLSLATYTGIAILGFKFEETGILTSAIHKMNLNNVLKRK